ncbi:MAG: AsmA family protein [Steroidobacteraceae bacterium]
MRALKITGSVLAALLLVIVVCLANLQWFRGPIEKAITSATGREAHIRGELKLRPWFPPGVVAGDISLANTKGSKDAQMFTATRLAIQPFFWRVVRGQLAFRNLEADGFDLLLETDDKNVGNWEFEKKEAKKKSKDDEPLEVLIRRLVLTDSKLRVRERAFDTELTLAARTTPTDKPDVSRLRLDGKGTYRKAPFSLVGRFDVPTTLNADDLKVDMAIDARAGATRLQASGVLPAAITTLGATVKMELSGDNLGDLFTLTGIALPETPPYNLAGQLGWKGKDIDWRNFKGKVGDSDLAGDAKLELREPRPRITAQLKSALLDFDDLGSLIGIPPATGEGETASPEQKQVKAELTARERVLPTSTFSFEKLNSVDADVTLKADRIRAPKLPLETLDAHVKLAKGVLKIDPFDFKAAGGTLHNKITFDSSRDPLGYSFEMDLRELKLAEIVPQAESLKDAVGRVSGKVAMKGTGNSVAAMFASADGQFQVAMGQGEVSNLLLELAGLDVAEALKFLLGKDKKVAIRCAYADFKLDQGVANADAFALDTQDTALLGRGSIDLREERIDLTLLPRPKDRSPISLRSPLKIGGRFIDPSFGPQVGPLLLRGAAVAALASIAPPVALLALIETGPGKDVACGPGQRAGTADKPERK